MKEPIVARCDGRTSRTFLLVVSATLILLIVLVLTALRVWTERARDTGVLAKGREISLALECWAFDHNGRFPNTRADGGEARGANQVFANLIPNYVPQEKNFWISLSGWCNDRPPDEKVGLGKTLSAGENGFAYVNNLCTSSNPELPLIADAPADRRGRYSKDKTAPGGLFHGKKAIVFRVDGSGFIADVDPVTLQVMVPTAGKRQNSFTREIGATATPVWLSSSNHLLLPTLPKR